METEKNCMKWEDEGMRSYLEQTVSNSLDDAPGIHVGSFELKWVKISNDMEFLNFLLFIEIFGNCLLTFYCF